MRINRVNPPELPNPVGFSHAVSAEGQLVFLAGQIALNRAGELVGEDVVTQFEQALANLLTALSAAGGTPDQLASVTIYATDLADYRTRSREIGAVWRRLVGRDYPAMAGIGVSQLWEPAALVEIQGCAVIAPA